MRGYHKPDCTCCVCKAKRGENIGWHHTEETKRKISEGRLGDKHWFKGKHHSKETKMKMSKSHLEDNNHMWKDGSWHYNSLHKWLKKNKAKPERCEFCNKKNNSLNLSNINGIYNRDIDNYYYLCPSCHKRFDYAKANENDLEYLWSQR